MKLTLLVWALTISAFSMADTEKSERQEVEEKQPIAHITSNDQQVVVITEAEFVPFSQYLGVPDVNNLPPTSAGKPAQQRMP